jgi:hypothetical protein
MSILLDRLNGQISQAKVERKPDLDFSVFQNRPPLKEEVKPIESSVLRKLLMENLEEKPVVEIKEEIVFDGIVSFVSWYLNVVTEFSEGQNKALSTLVDTRNMIENGCGCKRHHRQGVADGYFRTFWAENGATDMPKRITEVAAVKTVKIMQGSELLLTYTSQV